MNVICQSQTVGLTQTGTRSKNNFDPVLQSFGCIDLWDARYGIQLNSGTTNITKWAGVQGSSHLFVNYGMSNAFGVSTITTNNFPAASFAPGQTNILRCDTIAQAANTSRGFTVAVLLCQENLGVAMNPFCFGWTGSTNNNSPTFRLAPHLATQTSGGVGFTYNTNGAFGNYTSWTGGNPTNVFEWIIAGYSNNQVFAMQNLLGGQTQLSGPGTFTVDLCCLGGRLDGFGNPNRFTLKVPAFISAVCVASNFVEGAARTNLFWYLNTNYANGFYKVLNSP